MQISQKFLDISNFRVLKTVKFKSISLHSKYSLASCWKISFLFLYFSMVLWLTFVISNILVGFSLAKLYLDYSVRYEAKSFLFSDDEARYNQKCSLKVLLQIFWGEAPRFTGIYREAPGFTIILLVACQTHQLKRLLVISSPAIIFCHYRDIISTTLRLFDKLVWRLTFNIRKTKLY